MLGRGNRTAHLGCHRLPMKAFGAWILGWWLNPLWPQPAGSEPCRRALQSRMGLSAGASHGAKSLRANRKPVILGFPASFSFLNHSGCPVQACSVAQSWPLCGPMDCILPVTLSMEFSRQEYWSGLPLPPPGDSPNSGIKPTSSAFWHWATSEAL